MRPYNPREVRRHKVRETSHRKHCFLTNSVSIPHSPRALWFSLGEIPPLFLPRVGPWPKPGISEHSIPWPSNWFMDGHGTQARPMRLELLKEKKKANFLLEGREPTVPSDWAKGTASEPLPRVLLWPSGLRMPMPILPPSQAHRKHHAYLVGPTCCKMPGGWWAPPESWLGCWAPLYW